MQQHKHTFMRSCEREQSSSRSWLPSLLGENRLLVGGCFSEDHCTILVTILTKATSPTDSREYLCCLREITVSQRSRHLWHSQRDRPQLLMPPVSCPTVSTLQTNKARIWALKPPYLRKWEEECAWKCSSSKWAAVRFVRSENVIWGVEKKTKYANLWVQGHSLKFCICC